MIYDLFPSAIGHYQLNRDLTNDELNFVHNIEQKQSESNRSSASKYLFQTGQLNSIKSFCNESIQSYVADTLAPKDDVEFYITQSWSNYTKKGEYHHKHKHPNSFFSGVFYFQTELNRDVIMFYKESLREDHYFGAKDWNQYNSLTWEYPVTTGDLFLFPSNTLHNVPKIEQDGVERISLSFNTYVCGEIGSEDNANKVILDKAELYR